MANAAVLTDKSIIDADSMSEQDFLEFQVKFKKEKLEVKGLWCNHPMFPRKGNKVTRQHFVHYTETADCQYNSRGESDQHKALKLILSEEATKLGFDSKVENRLNNKAISDVSVFSKTKHLVLEVQLAAQTYVSYITRTENRTVADTEVVWLTTDDNNLYIPNVTVIKMKNIDSKYYTRIKSILYERPAADLDDFKKNVRNNARFVMHDSKTEQEVELNAKQLVKTLMSPKNKYVTKGVIEERKLEAKRKLEEAEALKRKAEQEANGSNGARLFSVNRGYERSNITLAGLYGGTRNALGREALPYTGSADSSEGVEPMTFRSYIDSAKPPVKAREASPIRYATVVDDRVEPNVEAELILHNKLETEAGIAIPIEEVITVSSVAGPSAINVAELTDVIPFIYIPHMYRDYNAPLGTYEFMHEGYHLRLREVTHSELELGAGKKNCGHALKNAFVNPARLYDEDAYTAQQAVKALQAVHGNKWCHKTENSIFEYTVIDRAGIHMSLFDMLINGCFEQVRD